MSLFLLKNFQDLNNPFSLLVPFLFSLCGRWFSRDNKKKKCSTVSHDIQRLVSNQARYKRNVFRLFIRIDTAQSLRTNASCNLAHGRRKKKFSTARDTKPSSATSVYFVPCHSISAFRCGVRFNDSHDQVDLNYDMYALNLSTS